jgi:ApaG protein
MGRRWLITDSNGKQMSVEGDGVVGKQPVINSNDEYTYTSGTALETPVGVMQGQYIMQDEKGNEFITEIDPFRLAVPNVLN